ncbi:hypothetical protein OR1_02493 [Geobacter sp. OR-1]|uniref:hypothetical protein n=1 Tax=Geobacter sp. OR-1 TaxID=1266765 RepID=UPI000542D8C3|nr:hypothetical protein [Geobacter sp. OR-1]GAM10205.1 hypothetical protein OR1_02493 [Geobacter sp. OR-1]
MPHSFYGDGNGNKGAGAGTMVGHGSTSGWSGTSNCSGPANSYMNNSCQNCHCGRGFSGTGAKGTHSTTATLGGATAHSVGFANGNAWMGGPWGTGSTSGCYAISSATNYGDCNKGANHASSDNRFKKNFMDIINPLKQLFAADMTRYSNDGNIPVLIESVREQQRMLDNQSRDINEIKGMIREMNR